MNGSGIREQQVAMFEDTMEQLRSNKTLATLTEQAKSSTRLYMEGFRSKNRPEYETSSISVIESRSFQAAKELTSEYDRVAVLNLFRNPPQLVSQVFRSVLEADGYKKHFAKIVFAIIGTSNRSNENLTVFKRTLS
jgi:hypothetical protein